MTSDAPYVQSNRVPVSLLILVQLLCLSGFAVALVLDRPLIAVGILLAPLVALLFFVLSGREIRLVVSIAAMIPLAAFGLLPRQYVIYVLIPVTILLLAGRYLRFIPGFDSSPARPSRHLRAAVVVLLVMGLLAILNARRHGWAGRPVYYHTLVLYEVLLVAWFFAVVPRTGRQIKMILLLMTALVFGCGICFPLMSPAVGEGGVLGGKILRSLFDNINLNSFGAVLSAFSAIALCLALDRGSSRRERLVLGLVLVTLVAALVLTKSRGAWLGFGAAYLYILYRERSLRLVAATAVVGALTLASDILTHVIAVRAAETGVADPSLTGRFVLWSFAGRVFKDNWLFGVGMENFRRVKHHYGFPAPLSAAGRYNTHNIYLEILTGLGAPGLLSFLWLAVAGFLGLDRVARLRSPRRQLSYVALGANAGLIAYLVHGLVDSPTWHYGTFLLLGVLFGLSFGVVGVDATEDRRERSGSGTVLV